MVKGGLRLACSRPWWVGNPPYGWLRDGAGEARYRGAAQVAGQVRNNLGDLLRGRGLYELVEEGIRPEENARGGLGR